MNNPECKKCGLMRSTIIATGKLCLKGGLHDYVPQSEVKCCECPVPQIAGSITCIVCGKYPPHPKEPPVSQTVEGLEEMRLRLRMKAYEKQIAATGTLLRAMEMEWKHSNII